MQFRLRNIHTYKSRHGKTYIYYRDRRTGFLRRLPSDTKSPEFYEAWKQADADNHGTVPEAQRGTWNEIKQAYLASPEYAALKPRTVKDYLQVLTYLTASGMDSTTIDEITPPSLVRLRNKVALKKNWRFSNYCLAVISRVFSVSKNLGMAPSNPATGVPKLKAAPGAKQANRPWTDRELDTMLTAADPVMRAAIAIGAYTGMREGDVLKFTWAMRSLGYIRQNKTDEELFVPEHSSLAKILDKTPKSAIVVVVNTRGKPYTEGGFRTMFAKFRGEMLKAGKIGAGLTFHGLRHTVATKLADAGADDKTIAAVTGHKSMSQIQRYTRTASQKRRATAAIRLIDTN
jgi:integrase